MREAGGKDLIWFELEPGVFTGGACACSVTVRVNLGYEVPAFQHYTEAL